MPVAQPPGTGSQISSDRVQLWQGALYTHMDPLQSSVHGLDCEWGDSDWAASHLHEQGEWPGLEQAMDTSLSLPEGTEKSSPWGYTTGALWPLPGVAEPCCPYLTLFTWFSILGLFSFHRLLVFLPLAFLSLLLSSTALFYYPCFYCTLYMTLPTPQYLPSYWFVTTITILTLSLYSATNSSSNLTAFALDNPVVWGTKLLWNVCNTLPINKVSHPRRHHGNLQSNKLWSNVDI